MKKFLCLSVILFLIAIVSVHAAEFTYTFSQGDEKLIHFENMDLEIKLVQATNFNAVFSLNGRLISEIQLGEKHELNDRISIYVVSIEKKEGKTFVTAVFDFEDTTLDLAFLERPIAHSGTSIGTQSSVDTSEYSKRKFVITVGQKKQIVDLNTEIQLLDITDEGITLMIHNDRGSDSVVVKDAVETLGVRIHSTNAKDNKAELVVLKSSDAVISEFEESHKESVQAEIAEIGEDSKADSNVIDRLLNWLDQFF